MSRRNDGTLLRDIIEAARSALAAVEGRESEEAVQNRWQTGTSSKDYTEAGHVFRTPTCEMLQSVQSVAVLRA